MRLFQASTKFCQTETPYNTYYQGFPPIQKYFSAHSSVFRRCAHSCFLCKHRQKNYQSYRNFCNWEIYFLRGKTLALGRKMLFMGQCTTFLIIWNDKKKFCALARSFWPSARFWDFFGLQKAFGLLQAKKIPKTGLRPK